MPPALRLTRCVFHTKHINSRYFSNQVYSVPKDVAREQWKRPQRGGQNLSERYRRLENTLRGKEAFAKHVEQLSQPSDNIAYRFADSTASRNAVKTFRGFVIPEEPEPPQSDECCMSGCAVCVYDLYQESLEAFNQSVASLRVSLTTMHVPESEWPASIRTASQPPKGGVKKDISLSVFEEMERALMQKRERLSQAEAGS